MQGEELDYNDAHLHYHPLSKSIGQKKNHTVALSKVIVSYEIKGKILKETIRPKLNLNYS